MDLRVIAAIASIIGFVVMLGETLNLPAVVAIVLVSIAAGGASYSDKTSS